MTVLPPVISAIREGEVTLRPIRLRDSRQLERVLLDNRGWLRKWEASHPQGTFSINARVSIRNLLRYAREGYGVPFIVEYRGLLVGQLNVSSIVHGSMSSANIGYWIAQEYAGRGITPVAVALATDYCFGTAGLHRVEICIRPENKPSLRIVEKLGFRYEGLRRRYIHIAGSWCDHFAFALCAEEVPGGVLHRWLSGEVPMDVARVPDADRVAAGHPLPVV